MQAWQMDRGVGLLHRASRYQSLGLYSLLGLGLLIRLFLARGPGYFDDLQLYVNWGALLDKHFFDFYSAGASISPQPNYPPLAIYIYGILTYLYGVWAHLAGARPDLLMGGAQGLNIVMKLPTLICELGLTAAIYTLARRTVPSRRYAYLVAAAYAFSPVVLMDGPVWGQIDAAYTLGLTLALLATVRGRGLLAGVLFGLALMLKPQPVVFAPLLLVYLWRWSGGRQALRAAAGAAGTILLVCLPYLLPPRFEVLAYQQDLDRWVKAVPYTSVSAFNLWWMLGIQKMPYTAPYLGPLSPNVVGWALFIVVLAITVASTWNDSFPGRLFFSVGLLTVAMFIVLPLQHERYVLPAVVFFLLAVLYEKRHAVFYVATSIMALLNMVLVVIAPVFSDSRIPYNLAKGRHFLRMHPQVFTALAAIDVLLFVAMVVVYLRQVRKAQPAVIAAESPVAWSLAGLAEPRHAPVQYAPSWHSSAAVKTLSVSGESADLDSTFWTGVRATCSALAHNDTWMARLCLDSIIAAIMSPWARRERDVSSPDVLPDRREEHQPSRVQIAHWRTPEDAHTVLDVMLSLIANYRDLRQRLRCGGSGGEPSLREREATEALAEVERQPAISASEALTGCSLSMVLPAYREEAVIADTVQACLRAAERFCPNVEVIVVNDGSSDRTGEIIDELAKADPRVVALHHPVNKGYGAALLTGFAFARGDLLFFMDSDGQFDVRGIADLLRTEAQQPGVVVIGYRAHRRDTALRIVNAWGWKHLVGLILGLRGIRDIDCAFKLFPTRLVQACQVTSEGAMVNTELLAKLQRMRVPLVQVPVQHFPRMHGQATGANLSVIAKAFRELLRLRLRLHVWQPPAADAPAARGGMGDNADLVYEMESSATPSPVA